MTALHIADCGFEKAESVRRKAKGSKKYFAAYCLLLSAFSSSAIRIHLTLPANDATIDATLNPTR
jgi:hypothetical protein